jgi:hypothetical protein
MIMDDVRRRLIVVLVGVLGALWLLPGVAQAAHANPAVSPAASQCVLHSLPSFIDQGLEAHASSVADIVEVECNPSEYDGKIRISDVELYDRCAKHLSWSPTNEFKSTEGPATEATLDDDGSATVVLWGGPNCKPGESQIVVDEVGYPNETYMTPFTVLPPEETAEGVYALPASQVEDSINSSVATIVEVEFPSIVEKKVAIDAEQLFSRCKRAPHAIWVGPDEEPIKGEGRIEGESALETDDDGNAFVVLLGASSCQPGKVLISASLEEDPFTTVNTIFTIESPRPTFEEEAFKVEKEQKLPTGSFTKEKLVGKIGEIVDYRIVVTNTGDTSLDLASITDANCTNIKGPTKAEIAPREQSEYTCEHELTTVGTWINQAQVESSTHHSAKSNEVEVEAAPPVVESLQVEKEQKLPGGAFTKEQLYAKALGEIIDYRIVVTNTGNVSTTLAAITDPNCTNIVGPLPSSTLAPNAHAEYTCEHELTSYGTWINSAIVETTTHNSGKSNEVTVVLEKKEPGEAIRVEKEQQVGAEVFTKKKIVTTVGETVHYRITVVNTGTTVVRLTSISDANCTNLVEPAKTELKPEESTSYTCEHQLTGNAPWTNVATVETEGHLKSESNKVEAEAPEMGPGPLAKELFTAEKEQKLGTAGTYSKAPITDAKPGETIYYRIVETNTGEVAIPSLMTDPGCTNVQGPSKAELKPGEHAEWTCEHTFATEAIWKNVASVETPGMKVPTNEVEAKVAAKKEEKGVCALSEKSAKIINGAGVKRKPFTISVGAVGIGHITVYLDGRKLKTLTHSQSRFQRFSVRIDPRKLSLGAHKIVIRLYPKSALCGKIATAALFVHPESPYKAPRFTG